MNILKIKTGNTTYSPIFLTNRKRKDMQIIIALSNNAKWIIEEGKDGNLLVSPYDESKESINQ
jgi:hypothetical protein